MKRILILFLFATGLVVVAFAQTYDSNMLNQNANFCTGGACRIDTMKQHSIIQDDNTHSDLQKNNTSDYYDDGHNRGGLNNSGDFTYDFNCQFGNCLPRPSGSYQP